LRVCQELDRDQASPLAKARIFSLVGRSRERFFSNRIDQRYILEVKDRLNDFKLSRYDQAISADFSSADNRWRSEVSQIEKKYLQEIIESYIIDSVEKEPHIHDISAKVLVEWSEILGAFLVGCNLKTSQVRKFLDAVRKVELVAKKTPEINFKPDQLVFLKVYLAYATARQDAARPLMLVMNAVIDRVDSGIEGFADFQQFVKLVEGIIAYHKFYGGGD
jgi:CRISPR-associated protein Csm2